MATEMSPSVPLNEVQVMLLRLFSRQMNSSELQSIQKILLDYYNNELQEELEKTIQQKGITRADFENKLQQQQRTKS